MLEYYTLSFPYLLHFSSVTEYCKAGCIYGCVQRVSSQLSFHVHKTCFPRQVIIYCQASDRSIVSSKASSPDSEINLFLFQLLLYSSCFMVIRQLLMSSFSSSPPLSFLCLSFNNAFQKAIPMPFHIPFLNFIECRMFIFSLALYNTSSRFIRSVQLISVLLQHQISKVSRYFQSTLRNVYEALFQQQLTIHKMSTETTDHARKNNVWMSELQARRLTLFGFLSQLLAVFPFTTISVTQNT